MTRLLLTLLLLASWAPAPAEARGRSVLRAAGVKTPRLTPRPKRLVPASGKVRTPSLKRTVKRVLQAGETGRQ